MNNATIHMCNKLADAGVEYNAESGNRGNLMKWSGPDVLTYQA
jgi:hypothetical protein